MWVSHPTLIQDLWNLINLSFFSWTSFSCIDPVAHAVLQYNNYVKQYNQFIAIEILHAYKNHPDRDSFLSKLREQVLTIMLPRCVRKSFLGSLSWGALTGSILQTDISHIYKTLSKYLQFSREKN